MKKLFRFSVGVAAIFFLFCGSAIAVTYTYLDVPASYTDSWPGYAPAGFDYIGHPSVTSMEVTINDTTNYLEEVKLHIVNRGVPDSLFINTGGDGLPYEAWDFYVRGTLTAGPSYPFVLYTVAPVYTYELTTYPYRPGHPVGFVSGITADALGRLDSVTGGTPSPIPTELTYIFKNATNPGIEMLDGWVIGYTQYCANEVIITPEPISLLLLGLGLVGVAGMKRKFRS